MSNKQVENETVSIIIPVYNCEKYIRQCVDSVINQTYHDLEIILIDDGSTDKSLQILEEYYNLDNRVKIVHQKNQGLSASRNQGLVIAKGKYIFFLDADDFLATDQIEVLYRSVKKNDADVAISTYINFNDTTATYLFHVVEKDYYEETYTPIELMSKKYHSDDRGYLITLTTAWGKLFKRSLFKNVLFPVGKTAEDDLTIWKVFLLANKINYINKGLYIYRLREGSISYNNLYKVLPVEADVERIAFLSLLNIDTSTEQKDYINRLKITKENALRYGEYQKYNDASLKLNILKKYGVIDE